MAKLSELQLEFPTSIDKISLHLSFKCYNIIMKMLFALLLVSQ